jgi:hypothetical protein
LSSHVTVHPADGDALTSLMCGCAWPGERSGRLLALYGVEPPDGAFSSRLEAQDALRDAYPLGGSVTVRVSRDVAYVDRQDWFSTALFVFCVVFTLLMSLIALIVVNARAGSRVKPPSS